ncbi:MAG: hypothetical protein PHU81_08115 [Acidobacteriota bacterium]|nr:hypothetical protein [Acidobacteriota bacterium]
MSRMMRKTFLCLLSCLLMTTVHLSLVAADGRSNFQTPGLLLTEVARPQELTTASEVSTDELARLVSGLPTGNPVLKSIEEDPAWVKYQAFLDSAWKKFKTRLLDSVEAWSKSELAGAREKTDFLFYPFGGPDLITALAFFPEASSYLLVGLEPGGYLARPEDFKKKTLDSYLSGLQSVLSGFFKKGYFITMEMNEELNPGKINGVLPLLCLFLERTNHTISEIKRVEFDEQGQPVESEYTVPGQRIKRPLGFKLTCLENSSGKSQTIYYISCDLSDERFGPGAKFYFYLNRFDHWSCLIKSASYLLHFKNFSHLRQMLLEKSQHILQDDTGLPFKYFQTGGWEVKLFGQYGPPVKDFKNVEQDGLKAAYQDKKAIKPLPFHFGYHWQSHLDNLILAEKLLPAEKKED